MCQRTMCTGSVVPAVRDRVAARCHSSAVMNAIGCARSRKCLVVPYRLPPDPASWCSQERLEPRSSFVGHTLVSSYADLWLLMLGGVELAQQATHASRRLGAIYKV